jgi:hypothetical protein
MHRLKEVALSLWYLSQFRPTRQLAYINISAILLLVLLNTSDGQATVKHSYEIRAKRLADDVIIGSISQLCVFIVLFFSKSIPQP